MKWLKWIGIVLTSVIVLPALTLFAMGHRSNAGRVRASVEIAASPGQVWVWLDDSARLKQWVSWLVEVREPQPPHHAVGSPTTWVMKDENNGGAMMAIDAKYVEYAPPSRLTVTISTPAEFEGQQTYQLTGLGNGHTRLDVDGRYRYDQWFARLLEPLITPAAEKKMAADLTRLKGLVETKAELR